MEPARHSEPELPGKTRRIIHPADMMTLVRIALIPLLCFSETSSMRILSLSVFSLMILTDILDGTIARMYPRAGATGAVYDLVADFIVIIFIYTLLFVRGEMNPFPLVLTIVSSTCYSLYSFLYGKIVFGRLGKYAGVICYGGIAVFFFTRIGLCGYSENSALIVSFAVSIYLGMTTVETIVRMTACKRKSIRGYKA
jgi:phosphatidylglycerophosphate synthase